MQHLIVVGGGWSGCAAALAAAKKGLAVTLIERTDRLLASGLVGGIMRNNGRYTAAEELKLMGAGELVEITDCCARHAGIDFPGHRHASFYDVGRVELPVLQLLQSHGVKVLFGRRVVNVEVKDRLVRAVILSQGREVIRGTVFIDASGTAGPTANCSRFGNGCAMCIFRCPTFGPRVSIAVKAGAEKIPLQRPAGQPGYFSGSCELEPSSLSPDLLRELRQKGVVLLPLPRELIDESSGSPAEEKACRQYVLPQFKENIVLIDNGAVKMMAPFFSLQALRRFPGLERAVYRDPLGGGRGNSIRFSGMVLRDNRLLLPHLDNLLVAGERAGLALGHTEAMVTGTLAGYNAWRISEGLEPVLLPRNTVCGTLIYFTRQMGRTAAGRRGIYTLSGGLLWDYIRKRGLYTTDRDKIYHRLQKAGALAFFEDGS